MSQSNSIPSKRLPGPLAQMLKDAGERSGDPQASFLRDFAAEAGAPLPTPAPSSEAIPNVEPFAPVPANRTPRATRTRAAARHEPKAASSKKDVPAEGMDPAWSKKTYRLRPDQYEKLALLQAYLLGDRHARIGASELAREAFDLLFNRYSRVLGSRQADVPTAEEGRPE